jgi:hypothetical protein
MTPDHGAVPQNQLSIAWTDPARAGDIESQSTCGSHRLTARRYAHGERLLGRLRRVGLSCVANFLAPAEHPFAGDVGSGTKGAAMSTREKILDFETPSGKARGNGDDALEDVSLKGGEIVDEKDLQESGDPSASASTARAKDALGDASRRLPAGKDQR